MLQSLASQSVGHKLATKQQQLCQQGLVSVSQNLPSPGRVSTGWKVSSRPARWAPSGLGRSPRHLAGQQLPAKSRGLKLAPVQPLSASWGGALAGAAGVGEGALQGLSRGCRDLPQALPMCQACFISAHATFTPTGRLTASRSRVS